MTAKLIVFEGANRSGKTTQAKVLFEFIKGQKFKVLYTKEPQEKAIGAVVKQMIRKKGFSRECVAIAFAADTMHHIDEVIRPAIDEYDYIIMDRYYLSSYAYHPLLGCKQDWIESLHRYVIQPDITFVLDIPLLEFQARAQNRTDIFEKDDFQQKLRQAYLDLGKTLREDIVIVNGARSIEEIHSEIRKKVMFL